MRIGVKFLLFLYCFGYRNTSSQVRMLWEDHRNDLFINGFGECPLQRVRGSREGNLQGRGADDRSAHVCGWEQAPVV